jgi:hypothetical protein
MKGLGGGVRYKLTIHEEINAIESARRLCVAAGGTGMDWTVVDINEDQREALIASGYNYVRAIVASAAAGGGGGAASRPENRLVVFTWLKSTQDLDRCRRETMSLSSSFT